MRSQQREKRDRKNIANEVRRLANPVKLNIPRSSGAFRSSRCSSRARIKFEFSSRAASSRSRARARTARNAVSSTRLYRILISATERAAVKLIPAEWPFLARGTIARDAEASALLADRYGATRVTSSVAFASRSEYLRTRRSKLLQSPGERAFSFCLLLSSRRENGSARRCRRAISHFPGVCLE